MKLPSSKISKILAALAIVAVAAPVAYVKADHGGRGRGGDDGDRGRGQQNVLPFGLMQQFQASQNTQTGTQTGTGVAANTSSQLVGNTLIVNTSNRGEHEDEHEGRGRGNNIFRVSRVMSAVVESVSGSTLKVMNSNGLNVNVDATNASIQGRRRNLAFTVSDIQVGDILSIVGDPSADGNTFVATAIRDNFLFNHTTPASNAASLTGTISSVGTNSFVMTVGTASDTINTSATTTFTKSGAAATFADLAVGASATVAGTFTDAAHTIVSATSVAITPAVSNAASLTGTISSVGTSSFVLANGSTNTTINTSGATITKLGAAATFADLLATEAVSVTGTFTDATHTAVNATAINITTPIVAFDFTGPITAISGNTLTITNGTTAMTVDATSATLTKAGVTSGATLANFHVGDSVHVIGSGLQGGANVKATSLADLTA